MVEWGHTRNCRAGASRSGFSLIEILVALGLIAVSLMLILGLIPAGIQSSQRASDVQVAAGLARKLLEETTPPEDSPIPADQANQTGELLVGVTEYRWRRSVRISGDYLYRTEVEITWRDGVQPVKMSLTRYNPAGPPFETSSR